MLIYLACAFGIGVPILMAELMVGRRVLLRVEKTSPDPGDIALDVRDLTVRDKDGVELEIEVRRWA